MKKLRLLLEYQCYPLWIYNEKGEIILNDLPDELKTEVDIQNLIKDIQVTYNSLFIDNKVEFRYKGFDNEAEENEFRDKLTKMVQAIEKNMGNIYKIENSIDF
ncbi:hypothetical protein [Sporomusa termitida]|uniref:Uncharacterized protein n=1 Tax=Sporomusa termitida TaxID=2377 RepID=A0A517DRD7_9FIRM|nr:hypothetical protein [Sporomusa termitida]QDR79929.1 hypothetical protein SPTER_12310 [Sporomusa termitida]